MVYLGADSDTGDESASFKQLAARSVYQRGVDIRKMGRAELSELIAQGEARQAELVIKAEERKQINAAADAALQAHAEKRGNATMQLFLAGVANPTLHAAVRATFLAALAYTTVRGYADFKKEAQNTAYRQQTLTQYERELDVTGFVLHDLRAQLAHKPQNLPVPVADHGVAGWTAAARASLPDLGVARYASFVAQPFRRGGAAHNLMLSAASLLPRRFL